MSDKLLVIRVTGTLRPTCCARCTLPIKEDHFKIGRFVYDEDCARQVEEGRK